MRLPTTPGRLLILWMAGCWLAAPPLCGRPAIDLLVMKNGDRMTCEVKSLNAGVLSISLDYVDGLVSVQWSQVARLESKQLFIVQTHDGATYTGTLLTAPGGPGEPLRIEVATEPAGAQMLRAADVVEVSQTGGSFLRQLSGSLSTGSTYSKGNQATQYNVGADLAYLRARWGAEVAYQSNLSANKGAETTNRNQLDFTVHRLLPRRKNYFYFGLASFLQSSVQGISRQSSAGAGIGRYIKRSNQFIFSVWGGIVGQNTKYEMTKISQPAQQVTAGLVALELKAFKFKRTNLLIRGSMLPAISDSGRTYFRANATYYLKIFSNFTWNLSYYGSWDTKPPPGFIGSDYGASVGMGWKFNR